MCGASRESYRPDGISWLPQDCGRGTIYKWEWALFKVDLRVDLSVPCWYTESRSGLHHGWWVLRTSASDMF